MILRNNIVRNSSSGSAARAFLLVYLTLHGCPASAQGGVRPSPQPHRANAQTPAYHTPKAGSAERKAILDALRAPVEKDLNMPVIFVVDQPAYSFRVVRDWAFVAA